jgi:hypothetical protein
MMEDFYLPVRGGDTATRIETTKGLEYDGTKDVEYLQAKMFAALKIPKAYFGFEGDLQGKATLAAEDIRFARTVERIQKIMESELTKIALVHLYTQGFTGESLTNFEINLTTPSIIFEQEKVALLKEKVDLANQMKDTKLFSTDYIFENIFDLSEDQYMEMRELVKEDSKRAFRLAQIEAEGNDPVKTGKSYGTPHDLASLYGKGRMYTNPGDVPKPDEYAADDPKLGRPVVSNKKRNTQDDNFGKDRLGVKRMKDTDKNDSDSIKPKFQGGSPLALEDARTAYFKNLDIFKALKKKNLIFEKDNTESKLLDENQLKK